MILLQDGSVWTEWADEGTPALLSGKCTAVGLSYVLVEGKCTKTETGTERVTETGTKRVTETGD